MKGIVNVSNFASRLKKQWDCRIELLADFLRCVTMIYILPHRVGCLNIVGMMNLCGLRISIKQACNKESDPRNKTG